MKKDVNIMGAGIIGLSIAYFLSKRSFSSLLIERNEGVALESSFGNGGGLWPTLLETNTLIDLGEASLQLFDMLAYHDKLNFEYRRNGVMEIALNYEELKLLEQDYERKKANFYVELLSPKEALDLEPNLSKEVKGSLYHVRGAHGNCYLLAKEFEGRILDSGSEIRLREKVVGLSKEGNKIKKVLTEKGEDEADWFINSCGAWSKELAEKVRFNLPVKPAKGIMITFEKTNKLLNSGIVSSKIGIVQTLKGNLRAGGT
ncbi:MAG: FAD-dependent oxidoreductase [Nitrososphaerales archaeon]